jgi:hypothetical protein
MSQPQRSTVVETSPLLSNVRDIGTGLSIEEKELIGDQVLRVIRDFYVHLPLKVSSIGINPVRELELLIDDARYIASDSEFFYRLLTVVNRTHDRHTTVKLPAPLDNAVAFLPFALESCWENGARSLIVSKLTMDLGDPQFSIGVEITHWNGIPIGRYIERLSWQTAGANPFARIAIALRLLTTRPLAYILPPDEDWVVLTYRGSSSIRSLGVPWRVHFTDVSKPPVANGSGNSGFAAATQGVDRSLSITNMAWKELYAGTSREVTTDFLFKQDPLAGVNNPLPNNLIFRLVRYGRKTFGLIRIFSFDAPDVKAFIRSFAEILSMMPSTGVILDVRANPGGTIPAGEAVLQLLTKRPINAARLEFRITPEVEKLANVSTYFTPWRRSLLMKYETGEIFSQGYTLYSPELTEGLSGIYNGNVAIIIDGLSYSTTDFFIAGIQDNALGAVIGIDPTSGAGGANVWSHAQLFAALGPNSGLETLPASVNMNVALRRSVRTGFNDGLPLEGLGVLAEQSHYLTRRDVLGNNEDLLSQTVAILASIPPR